MSTSSQKLSCSDSIHAGDPDYICNPATGRYVLKDGRVGRQLVRAKRGVKKSCNPLLKESGMVCNHISGKWIRPDGYIGENVSREKRKDRPCRGDRKKAKKLGRTVCNKKTGYWTKPKSKKK